MLSSTGTHQSNHFLFGVAFAFKSLSGEILSAKYETFVKHQYAL